MLVDKNKAKRESHPIIVGLILFFAVVIIIVGWNKMREGNKTAGHRGQMSYWVETPEDAEEDNGQRQDIFVVVDPGHGGNDPGKVSWDGVFEKDINLQISILLEKELESRGIQVALLREEDKNLATQGATNKKVSDMKNRVRIINDYNPDVLVSIHQNSYSDSSVRGAQVFYHEMSEESKEFALILQDKLKAINPEYGREAKEGNDYYILNRSICPGVIVECGFLSCPEETALLSSEEYQQKIASAISDAIEQCY